MGEIDYSQFCICEVRLCMTGPMPLDKHKLKLIKNSDVSVRQFSPATQISSYYHYSFLQKLIVFQLERCACKCEAHIDITYANIYICMYIFLA